MFFSEIYTNISAILAHPEQYTDNVTHFSAGGHGACAYQEDITAAELAMCWQHEEYQHRCPVCGETAYITLWAGHATGGGYWQIKSYCPHCGHENNGRYCGYTNLKGEPIRWTRMRDILKEVLRIPVERRGGVPARLRGNTKLKKDRNKDMK